VTETVHACPPNGSNATPCCGESPFDLPPADRGTEDRRKKKAEAKP
jgi:hypothetical protein